MKLVANRVTKTTKWLPFLLLSNTVHEYPRKIIPTSKVWNLNSRKFFPRNLKKGDVEIVNGFLYRVIWVRLYPDFNNYAFGNCVNFSGKKITAKSKSARTLMHSIKHNIIFDPEPRHYPPGLPPGQKGSGRAGKLAVKAWREVGGAIKDGYLESIRTEKNIPVIHLHRWYMVTLKSASKKKNKNRLVNDSHEQSRVCCMPNQRKATRESRVFNKGKRLCSSLRDADNFVGLEMPLFYCNSQYRAVSGRSVLRQGVCNRILEQR